MPGLEDRGYRAALSVVVLAAGVVVSGCNQPAATPPAEPAPAQSLVERGEYLVNTGGCDDCHSPKVFGPNGPEPDRARRLSGYPENGPIPQPHQPTEGSVWTVATTDSLQPWSGPWGVSYPANLTPDTLTGLRSGVWTEELFIQALRTGKHMGTARPILPPMPWPVIGKLTDDDLKAIWAYLGTIPPINNHVPDPVDPTGAKIE